MLTQNEITSLSLSPTKKDFVQIWNELLDVAGKLSERWDPTSTNESDPGIVILKALAGIADKLNYNIDKNTLEAFMPTAAQEDSMRKLCEMLGYNVKYYRAAKTDVTIKYHNPDPSTEEAAAIKSGELALPKFSVITNADQDIYYFTLNESPIYITDISSTIEVTCMEGQLVQCESINDNNVITANQITENNRYYLPETQVAENGIFVYNIFNTAELTGEDKLKDGVKWTKVDNLNAQPYGSTVYKFGFDSYESRPYIEFPEDYAELFGDGIFIYYSRTSGAAGNVSARTLTKLEFPSSGRWGDIATESISVENAFSATTGANVETIKQAYNNFKKTIGTFDTLVTCRDYMNKIYSMQNHLDKPLVSNVLVTDIRNDLNRAVTICSADRAGIFYKETSLIDEKHKKVAIVNADAVTITGTVESEPYETDDPVFDREYDTDEEVLGTAGKPYYSEEKKTNSSNVLTNWRVGSEDGPLFTGSTYLLYFKDDAEREDVSNKDGFTAKYGSKYAKKEEFDNTITGEVEELNGFWIIKQKEKYFRTILPAERVPVKARIFTQKAKYRRVDTCVNKETTLVEDKKAISNFDLVLYPFKSYTQIKNNVRDVRAVYDASFDYSEKTFSDIETYLKTENVETVALNLVKPRPGNETRLGDTISINNYLRLNATIATTSKITVEEGSIIIDKIKIALANAFNMRELDFGDEIPFDSIVEVIENADARIKTVSMNEPALYTTFSVFTGYDSSGNPVIKEYAVASDWLTVEQASSAKRFDMDKVRKVSNGLGGYVTESLSTFNTKEARERYNELAVRNVLAGRLPLFDYNNTFKNSFSESAYQITREVASVPADAGLPRPNQNHTFTSCVKGDKVYSARYVRGADPIYSETFVPDQFANNVITALGDNAITDLSTECKVFAPSGKITDFTLSAGEFIKFRAPNFTTIKTYPAYVNYHLELNTETISSAINAEAHSLFDVLNSDRDSWTVENPTNNWQKALDYFKQLDESQGRTGENSYYKTADQAQKVSGYSAAKASEAGECSGPEGKHVNDGTGRCSYCGADMYNKVQTGPIIVDIKDVGAEEPKDLNTLLAQSGCLKLITGTGSNEHKVYYDTSEHKYVVSAILEWDVADGGVKPTERPSLEIQIRLNSLFITSSTILSNISSTVQTRLEEMVGQVGPDGLPLLPPTNWKIIFRYECVPFTPSSLDAWKDFITGDTGSSLVNFEPFTENGVCFWRAFGEGYSSGKYILQSSEKLLDFGPTYFGLLPESRLRGIYLIENVGKDPQAAIIANNEEYRLRANEYLYIEYTPSTTSDDGTSQTADPITEVLGEGTIIRPSGFEVGLKDSSVLVQEGTSYHKDVTFDIGGGGTKQVFLHSLGANEQIEVRDFARVELTKSSFKASPTIYYYKNFNDCDELEVLTKENGKRVNNTYTLKDGEYIFYTDQNKSELAYFSAGTEVTLEGSLTLNQFDVIELSTIFDSGMSEIPWSLMRFNANEDRVVFQEFQYISLGSEDQIKKLTLVGDHGGYLNNTWKYCDEVEYILAGTTEVTPLTSINTYDDRVEISKGCGWEVCSTLELDVDASSAQILRKTDKVQTSLTLSSTSTSGAGTVASMTLIPEDVDHPLAFKLNLSCQTSSSHINIDDVYSNPNKLSGFELKLFTQENPAIVETVLGCVTPYDQTVTDLTKWPGEELNIATNSMLWQEIDLDDIKVNATNRLKEVDHDNALRLPISILPDTYGVFSLYIEQTSVDNDTRVWIEVLPGTSTDDITILNLPEGESPVWEQPAAGILNGAPRLMLKTGMNCIRVNKTGRIFIKASDTAQGSLFFDELKLVNTKLISCSVSNGTNPAPIERSYPTLGLNIDQLGYLNPADVSTLNDTLSVIDEDTLISMKSGSVDAAITGLSQINKRVSANYSDKYKTLETMRPKLTSILDKVRDVKDELKVLADAVGLTTASADAVNQIHKLFTSYASLRAELEKENRLLDILKASKSLSLFESSELTNLLTSFSSKDETQQQLARELDAIETAALAELSNTTRETFIDNFDLEVSTKFDSLLKSTSTNTPEFLATLEKMCKEQIELDYNTKLVKILSSIDSVVNSEERSQLFMVLSSLKESASLEKRAEVLTKVKQIVETADGTELDALLESMLNTALNADYVTLDAILVKLKEHLENNNFDSLIVELELAAAESDDIYLRKVIKALLDILTNDPATTNIERPSGYERPTYENGASTIEAVLEGLLDYVKGLHGKDAEDTNVSKTVRLLYDNFKTAYKSRIKTLLESIYKPASGSTPASGLLAELDNINKAYSDAVEQLQTSQDAQVAVVLDELSDLADERSAALGKLVISSNNSSTFRQALNAASLTHTFVGIMPALPCSDEALYKAWKAWATAKINAQITETVKELSSKVQGLGATGTTVTVNTTNLLNRTVNSSNILVESRVAFADLAAAVADASLKLLQHTTYTEFLAGLPIVETAELKDAMTALNATNADSLNKRIQEKITTYNNSPSKKQQTVKELKEVLVESVGVLSKIERALISSLCPSLLNLEAALPEAFGDEADEFYTKWVNTLITSKNSILSAGSKDDRRLRILNAYETIGALCDVSKTSVSLETALKEQTLEQWLLSSHSMSELPDELTDILSAMRPLAGCMAIVRKAKETDFIDMSSDDIDAFLTDGVTQGLWPSESAADEEIKEYFTSIAETFDVLNGTPVVSGDSIDAYNRLVAENLLLQNIRAIDTDRYFYYTFPGDMSLAIDFNDSDPKLNTLMNPAMNYDINNVNNSFVISKLDIDYLDKGLQIARSSRLN